MVIRVCVLCPVVVDAHVFIRRWGFWYVLGGFLAEQTILQTLLSQVSQAIIRKLEKGKKLSAEEILLLYLDLLYNEMREMRRELNERVEGLRRELRDQVAVLDARIGGLEARISETNKRIDKLYELLAAEKTKG